jgi:hypothetical protein
MGYSKRHGMHLSLAALVALASTSCAMDVPSETESTGSAAEALTTDARQDFFVWSNILTGSGNANSGYSYNGVSSTPNRITQLATGQYRVDYDAVAGYASGGHVQVTAYGSSGERCKVAKWQASGQTLQVFVNCFAATGAPLNSMFTTSFTWRSGNIGPETAYLWANQQSASSYTLSTSYQWNSTGGAMSVTHTPGSGRYLVTLGGQDLSGGTVEVTAYGAGNAYCKVGGWGGTSVDVECFNGSNGAPVESQFDLLFSKKAPRGSLATYTYLWADQPWTSSYNPSTYYERGNTDAQYCHPTTQPNATITRSAVGSYNVRLPGMGTAPSVTNVKVTGYSTGSDTCEVVNWYPSGADAYVNVKCFGASGSPADAYYTLTFSSTYQSCFLL